MYSKAIFCGVIWGTFLGVQGIIRMLKCFSLKLKHRFIDDKVMYLVNLSQLYFCISHLKDITEKRKQAGQCRYLLLIKWMVLRTGGT